MILKNNCISETQRTPVDTGVLIVRPAEAVYRVLQLAGAIAPVSGVGPSPCRRLFFPHLCGSTAATLFVACLVPVCRFKGCSQKLLAGYKGYKMARKKISKPATNKAL
jgi:hypothetical protein